MKLNRNDIIIATEIATGIQLTYKVDDIYYSEGLLDSPNKIKYYACFLLHSTKENDIEVSTTKLIRLPTDEAYMSQFTYKTITGDWTKYLYDNKDNT